MAENVNSMVYLSQQNIDAMAALGEYTRSQYTGVEALRIELQNQNGAH